MTAPRRPILVLLAGAALRELLPLLRRLADWADPAGSAPGWTKPTQPVASDRAPSHIPAWVEQGIEW